MDRHKRHLHAVDSAGDGDELYVYVRDSRDGRSYRIEFKANIMGEYKLNGGGGFRPAREDVFEAAKEIARTHVTAELGHPVVSREDWMWVKESTAAEILEESDAYAVERIEGGGE